MENYSVQAVLSVKDKNFTSSMKAATSTLGDLDSSSQRSSSSVGALGTAFAVAQQVVSAACSVIKNSVADAVARVDTLNQYPVIMEQMGFSSEEAERSIQKLSDGIQGLPTSLDSIVASTQSIALLTGDLDLATDTALALNDAFLASGSSTAEAERGLNQYTQMLSSGKVDMQSWKTLQETMGYALKEVAKQLGITSGSTNELYSALQSGSITFDEFNAAIIECDTCTGGFAETASIACEGIATSWENVKTAVVRGVANMIQAWNEAANDSGIPTIQNSLRTLQNVVDTTFTAASKVITVFVKNLDTIVAACVPVVAGITSLKVIQSVSKYFDNFKKSANDVCSVLQNYTSKAENVAQATEKVERAEKLAKTASENYSKAQEKVTSALEKKQKAEAEAETAADNLRKADEELKNATDDVSTAQENYEAAAKASADANTAAAQAADEYKIAKEECAAAEEEATAASQMQASAQQEQAAAIEGTTTKAILQSAAMNVLTGNMGLAEAAMAAFNAVCDANPLGLIVTAVTAVTSAMSALKTILKKVGIVTEDANDKWKDLKDSVDDFYDSLEASDKEMKTNVSYAKEDATQINRLWAQIKTLVSYENLSADQTDRLNGYIADLNDAVPGLGLAFDEVTGSLNQSTDAVKAFIEAYTQLEYLSVITDAYTEAIQNQKSAEEELRYAQEQYIASTESMAGVSGILVNSSGQNVIALLRERSTIKDLEEEEQKRTAIAESLAAQRTETAQSASQALAEAYNYEVDALKQAVAEDTVSYDQLSEANQQTVDDMQSSISDLVSTMGDGTQAIVTDLDTTRDEYLKTMEENQQAVEEWGNNMETLRDRMEGLGLDTAVLDQWAEVPDQGIPMAALFVDATDEELTELAGYAQSDVETASDAFLQAWGVTADEIPGTIQEYITDPVDQSLAEQLRGISWDEPSADLMQNLWDSMAGEFDNLSLDELGVDVVDGVAVGMGDTSSIDSASGQVATDTEWFLRSHMQANSPSEMTKPIGSDLIEGIANGMTESTAAEEASQTVAQKINDALTAAFAALDFSDSFTPIFDTLTAATKSGMNQVKSAVTSGMKTVEAAFKSGFSSMTSVTSSQMSSIAASVSSGMSTVQSAMSSGMSSVKSTMSSGFQSVASTVTTQMNNIKSNINSGMSSIKSTVTSGMNNIKSSVTSGMNSIKSTVTSGFNSIKSTVTSAMNSVKSTIQSAMNSCKSSVSSAVSAMRSSFNSGMSAMRSAANSAASGIRSAFSGLYSSLYSAGANAMSGLQAGLNSRSGSVIATARSIANSVTSTINSALKVGSPSRVLKKTGKFAGQGLVDGLKAMLGDVEKVSTKMADAVNSMVFGSFDSPKLAFEGGFDMDATYRFDSDDILDTLEGIRTDLGERDAIDMKLVIHNELDGREIAKGTAAYMQAEQDKLQARKNRKDKFSVVES